MPPCFIAKPSRLAVVLDDLAAGGPDHVFVARARLTEQFVAFARGERLVRDEVEVSYEDLLFAAKAFGLRGAA